MTTVRLNRAGMAALLRSEGVRADLERRANAVKDAADRDASWDQLVSGEPGTETVPISVVTEVHTDRWVAQVRANHPAAAAVEAKHGVLNRALDAAG